MVTNESNSNTILKKRPMPIFRSMVGKESQNAPINEGAYPDNTEYKTYENLDQSIPKGYKFDVPNQYKSSPTPTTKFSSLSEQLGGGEYAHDPKNRGLLVQSYREDDYSSREKLRAGKSSRLFQVDHILPLSLGGTDNDKNKEVLSNKDHAQKTKVGAIARTLWYDDKISYPEAQVLALNWRDKDVSDVILDEKGVIVGSNPVGIAQGKIVEWQKPKKVSFSDWWTEVKGAPKAMLDKISKKVESIPSIELGKSMPAQFAEGLISQLALGYIPVEKETYEDASKQFAGNAAQMAGQMTGVIGSFMGLGLAARGIAAALGVTAKAARYVGATTKIAKAISGIPKVSIGQVRVAKTLENMGLFALHGQLSKQEQKGFDERAKRLLSDASFGAILSMPGKGLKGSARLWMGAFTVSAAFDPEDLNSALMNATVVTALHGLGKISSKNNLGKEVLDSAVKTRKNFGLETRNVKEKPYTPEELDIELRSSMKKVKETASSPEEAAAENLNLVLANREIYRAGLDSKTRAIVEQQDAVELQRKVVSGELENIGKLPKETIDIVDDFKAPKTKDTPNKQSAQQDNIMLEQPTGIIPATGINVGNRVSRQNLVNFIKGGAKKGDAVRLIIRDEKAMTNLLKGKDYKYPEKSVQIIDISNGPGTAKGIGYVPRESKIIEIGSSRESASFLPEGPKELPYNSSLNKNTYYDAMTKNGVRQMSATVERIGQSSNGMPYFEIKVTPENWAETIAVKTAKTSEVAKTMKSAPMISEKMKSKLNEGTRATDMIKSNKEFEDQDGAAIFAGVISDLQNAIISGNEKSISKAFKRVFKDGISKDSAEIIAADPTKFTVGNLVDFIKNGYREKLLTKNGESINNYALAEDGFYTTLNSADKAYIDSLKMVGNKRVGETVESVITKIKPRVESTPGEKVRVTVEKSQQKLPLVKAQEPLPKVLSSKAKVGEVKQEIKLEEPKAPVATEPRAAVISETIKKMPSVEAGKTSPESSFMSGIIRKGLSLGEEPGPLKVGKVDPKIIQEKIANRPKEKFNFSPKAKRAESIYKEVYEQTKSDINNLRLSSSESGNLNVDNYIEKLLSIINNVEKNIDSISGKAVKGLEFSLGEKTKIANSIKSDLIGNVEDLIFKKFDPAAQAEFAGSQMTAEKFIENVRKKIGTDSMKESKAGGFAPKDKGDFADVGPSYSKELFSNIKTAVNSKNKNAVAFNKTLDEGLTQMFGKDYGNDYKFNAIINPKFKNGKAFWKNMSSWLNKKGFEESQPKDVAVAEYVGRKKGVESGTFKTDYKEVQKAYERRAKEAIEEAEGKFDRPLTKEEFGDIKSAGLSLKPYSRLDTVSDLTNLDKVFKAMRASEASSDIKYGETESAMDATSFLFEILKQYNLSYPNSRTRLDPKIMLKNFQAIKTKS